MSPILVHASRNFLRRHPWQLSLAILGVALGVAVVCAIDLVIGSAQRAFIRSTETLVGKATHRIVGDPSGIDERLYYRLRVEDNIKSIAPVVEGSVQLARGDQRSLRVIGIDVFAERPFRENWMTSASPAARVTRAFRFFTDPGTVLMSEATAAQLRLAPEDEFDVIAGTATMRLKLIGTLAGSPARTAQNLDNLLLADIATAQEILGMVGRLSHIDAIADDAVAARIKRALTGAEQLVRAGARDAAVQQMTRAFYTNLTALSLLALLVGAFLIYNTIAFMVIQRRALIGNLRALGVTRREIFRVIIGEAAAIGIIGSALGLILGSALAQLLLDLVLGTLNNVYMATAGGALNYAPSSYLKPLLLGIGAALGAALAPAYEATRVPPRLAMLRSHLEQKARAAVWRHGVVGVLAMLLGSAVLLLSEDRTAHPIAWGFVGLFVLVFGATALTPFFTVVFSRCAKPLLSAPLGFVGRIASRSLHAAMSRNAVAIGALMLAVATSNGIGLMVQSFRSSVSQWLEYVLQSDIYLAAPGDAELGAALLLTPVLEEQIRTLPGVADVSTLLHSHLTVGATLIGISAYGLAPKSFDAFRFVSGDKRAIWDEFTRNGAVLVSESLAYQWRLEAGSTIALPTRSGARTFHVAGVYYDYGSQHGVVAITRAEHARFWDSGKYTAMGVYLRPGADVAATLSALRQLTAGMQLNISTTGQIRQASLDVFDQTFKITAVLQYLAALIACVGIFSALMALQLERSREHGVLRALGATPGQIRRIITVETGLMGVIAGLLAMPLGYLMANVLVFVINRRSFGWRMEFLATPDILAQGLLLSVIAAILAGLFPAARMSRTSPAEALRAE